MESQPPQDPHTPLPAEPDLDVGELRMLTQFIDYYRAVVRRKAEGLTAGQLNRTLAPSTMNLGGLIHHLDYVEDFWFTEQVEGQPASAPWDRAPWSEDGDWDWNRAAGLTPEELLNAYDERVARSRQIQQRWTDPEARVRAAGRQGAGQRMTYRYVLIHLVEEYSRHAGHADLLREAIDGTVGD
ncbi:DinB family protein [Microbacterium sp. A93]|uniref:DinB family protein n=1 Tax=Microbacterium sp. A93 TaxID=3450716 RepID=UPI003F44011A